MTATNNENQIQPKKLGQKIRKFLTSIVIVCGVIFLSFFAFNYWQNGVDKKLKAKSEVGKNDNVESAIFDLSADYDSNHEGLNSEVAANELKEKGAEFIYQTLIKQQLQIDGLQKDLARLQNDFSKYKSQEKIAKTVFAYVDLRQNFLDGTDFVESLKSFEVIAAFDPNLYVKVNKLKTLLAKFSGDKKVSESFQNLIPQLIINKSQTPTSGIFAKIYGNLSRLIIIRRTKEKAGNDVDNAIIKCENFLQERNYREAITTLLAIDGSYHEILKNFLDNLDNAAQVHELDLEIINYLKSLH